MMYLINLIKLLACVEDLRLNKKCSVFPDFARSIAGCSRRGHGSTPSSSCSAASAATSRGGRSPAAPPAPPPAPPHSASIGRCVRSWRYSQYTIDPLLKSQPHGVVLLEEEYVRGRKVFGQVVCTFRYGREEDEVMGLNFYKELFLASEQIYPPPEKRDYELTKTQERLLKKLGDGAYAFRLGVPAGAPGSVTLQPGLEDEGEPCGVHYYVKLFVGDSEIDRSHRRSTVALGIRKVQFAPSKPGPQPCTVVRKDFVLSPGQLELELTLDKQLYMHGETVAINMCVRNHSNKVVKKIKASIQQGVDVMLFQSGQYRNAVASVETQDGCPLQPGSSLQKVLHLTPLLASNRDKRGIALDGQLKRADTTLASTTLLLDAEQRDAFGIVVSYSVKVKLYLGALSGELVAELPFILMHPKEGRAKVIHADSQADVELFRQDTVHHQESVEVY